MPFSVPLRLKEAQFQIEALGFAGLAGLIRSLGPDRASAVSGAIWRRLAPLNRRHQRARANLMASLPGLSDAEYEAILLQMWENLGRTLAESFHFAQLMREIERFAIDDEVHTHILRAHREGAVCVSPHQGNWELAAPLFGALGLRVAGVYQKLKNPRVDAQVVAARAPFYPLGLHSKGNHTARHLMRAAAERGTILMMADLRDLTGVEVPFFGRMAPSTVFPALIARSRQVPLFAGVVERKEGVQFRVRLVEVPVAREGEREADILATTAALQAQFERFIRQKPGQWMWGHRRWQR